MTDDVVRERVPDYVIGGGVIDDVIRERVSDYVIGGGVTGDVVRESVRLCGRWRSDR